MAANDSHNSTLPPRGPRDCLPTAELVARLDEEVSRAGRQRTALSCLLVSLLDVEQLAGAHGQELPTQALDYLGAALGRQLRRFDRVGSLREGELLVLLPGADERRGEIVARRALGCTRSRSRSKDSANRCASLSVSPPGARGSAPINCSHRRVSPPNARTARIRCRPSKQARPERSAAICRRSAGPRSIIPRRAFRV